MAAKPKRNVTAPKRLRAIFVKVPEHKVHMGVYMEETHCGSAGCLIGWAAVYAKRDKKLRAALDTDFGLPRVTAGRLFALDVMHLPLLRSNPHAITKEQVLRQLDRVIEGKPIKPYVVKGA